jgi:hypothetical protein
MHVHADSLRCDPMRCARQSGRSRQRNKFPEEHRWVVWLFGCLCSQELAVVGGVTGQETARLRGLVVTSGALGHSV